MLQRSTLLALPSHPPCCCVCMLHLQYMESVWNVFQRIFDKKLVYRGSKIMPYSTTCHTPLSNFEVLATAGVASSPHAIHTDPPSPYHLRLV